CISTRGSRAYTSSMGNKMARRVKPAPRMPRLNYMAFPRELRAAIPDLHAGRALELDSINGQASNLVFVGALVELRLVVKETGKLTGEFVVGMSLHPEAARKLAIELTKLADDAERLQPAQTKPN